MRQGLKRMEPFPGRPEREVPVLFLDKDGRWFHQGVEITHPRTQSLFLRSLARGEDHRYYVRVGKESAVVEVEDTPFLITSVHVLDTSTPGNCQYRIVLNDGSEEYLDPRTVTIEQNNVMYARVKEAGESARFLRRAYYQICARVEYLEQEDRYVLPWKGIHITIWRGRDPADSEV